LQVSEEPLGLLEVSSAVTDEARLDNRLLDAALVENNLKKIGSGVDLGCVCDR
jgi:hypothetical protein